MDPFNKEALNKIFKLSPKHSDRVVSRENSILEFKESFGLKSFGKYIRSAAAFANNRGGYLVYGIKNKPHILKGLTNDAFESIDPEKISHFFNEHFDPEIKWERQIYEFKGKKFGIIYIYESQNKPVVCKKGTDDGKSLKEGEIYYRYIARSQTIRYSELKELIEERRRAEQLLWFKHLKEIARIGIQDAGIFNLRSGKISAQGGNLYIDESLLPQLAFLREGEFRETEGIPSIRLVGEAQIISGGSNLAQRPKVVKQVGIRGSDIILAFLKNEKLTDPKSYLTQICYENIAYYPFYFLLRQMKISKEKAKKIVSREPSTQVGKTKLLERMDADTRISQTMPSKKSEVGLRKLKIRSNLERNEFPNETDTKQLKEVLRMIRTLDRAKLNINSVKRFLLGVFQKKYAKRDSVLNDEIRRAICYVDWLENAMTKEKDSER